jgi:hypothetical protein
MQLVAYGAQDIYLTGNPQITFFKVVYRRHTNFAVEAIEQTFNGAAAFGQKFSCTISRNGDLLSRVYLEMDMGLRVDAETAGDKFLAVPRYGFDIIDHVEVEIGGQCIDKHYGDWMNIWTDLTHGGDSSDMLTEMVGLPEVEITAAHVGTGHADMDKKLYVPLQFWFCRNPGLALPLIALQYHEVKLNVQFNSKSNLVYQDGGTNQATTNQEDKGNVTADHELYQNIDGCCVFCDYIFLDTDERRRFAQVSHEYLIEQVQFSNALKIDTTGGQVELRFNHPVKEIFWHDSAKAGTAEAMGDCLLQLNGPDRFRARDGSYFRNVQRYEHHTGAGSLANLNMYSFALKPEEHQPSGTCNFSRIDNAVLNVKGTSLSTTLKVYAMNYNVLRIMSGMGGLAYSN